MSMLRGPQPSNCLTPALNSKGLRRVHGHAVLQDLSLTPALNSKGLRPFWFVMVMVVSLFDPSPEFKGIKTDLRYLFRRGFTVFDPSPEFKGIKTRRRPRVFDVERV